VDGIDADATVAGMARARIDVDRIDVDRIDLDGQLRRVAAGVIVLSRIATAGMVALSVLSGVQLRAYPAVAPAVAVYLVVGGWSAVLVWLVVRLGRAPGWALVVDVLVVADGVLALPLVVGQDYLADVANPDFEPLTVSSAVAVALSGGPALRAVLACATLAAAYAVAQVSETHGGVDVVSTVSTIGWQVGTAWCCLMLIRRLQTAARVVDAATRQVLRERERAAGERAEAGQRLRHFREQVRRYRALHDGPLRVLTAIAGPGPMGHPDESVRRQCAISVNVLRGTTPDSAGSTLTDLSLALVEAGGECAVHGLRVEYHFAGLPDDLPAPVVEAIGLACGEALTNVVRHAGTDRVRLTAMAAGADGRGGVTVAVVDQGKGFDPAVTPRGYGLRHSVAGRLAEVGGEATVDSHPGEGTRVDLRWPR
jgi:signal transduction histidine kinase